MAFTQNTLTLIAHGSGNQVFQYISNDDIATVETSGYFATDLLNKGDVILASLDLDGTPELVTYLVSATSSGVATIKKSTATSADAT